MASKNRLILLITVVVLALLGIFANASEWHSRVRYDEWWTHGIEGTTNASQEQKLVSFLAEVDSQCRENEIISLELFANVDGGDFNKNFGNLSHPKNLADKDGTVYLAQSEMLGTRFPHSEHEVSYVNTVDGTHIAGTLTVPSGNGRFPAVVLISGSGPHSRDGEFLGHKPFALLADFFSRNGIAVLRTDDRGVGASGGTSGTATIEDLAEDVLSGLRFLVAHPDVNPCSIGLIGHSEGGMIASIAAARSDDVAFVVLLASA